MCVPCYTNSTVHPEIATGILYVYLRSVVSSLSSSTETSFLKYGLTGTAFVGTSAHASFFKLCFSKIIQHLKFFDRRFFEEDITSTYSIELHFSFPKRRYTPTKCTILHSKGPHHNDETLNIKTF